MFWRRFNFDWTYALGELLIVTLGVLIALAVDGWNSDRLERAEERDVVARLISDIDGDLRRFDLQLKAMDRKEASLQRLRHAFANGSAVDAGEFLADIVAGANFGWSQMTANRATFDGLLESGRLALVRDPDVRTLVAEYYRSAAQANVRIDERETEYPDLSYQLVPRGATAVTATGAGEGTLASGLSEAELSRLVQAVRASPLERHLIAEVNLGQFIRGVTEYVRRQGAELSKRLKEYQKQIA